MGIQSMSTPFVGLLSVCHSILTSQQAHTGQVIASHAVPPHAIFPTEPVSIRWDEEGSVLRQTFFAAQDEDLRLCSVTHEGVETGQRVSESSIELQQSSSPLTHLDVLITEKQKTLVAVQEDGTVTVTSSDLKQISSSKLERTSVSGAPLTLLSACCLSRHEASKSVLKSRGDIARSLPENSVIILDLSMQDAGSSQLPIYTVWCLPLDSDLTLSSPSAHSAQLLLQHNLWSRDLSPIGKTQVTTASFAARATTLDIKTHKDYVRFKLDGTVPTRVSATQLNVTDPFDVVSLSSSHMLLAYASSLQILDGQYGVAQAALDVKSSKKRKRSGSDTPRGTIELIIFFGQSQRMLVRIGTSLVAFDLRLGKEPRGKQSRVSRLALNVGRGRRVQPSPQLDILSLSFADEANTFEPAWSEHRAKLEQIFQQRDIATLEKSLLGQLASNSEEDQSYDEGRGPKYPGLFDATIDYVLTKIFTIVTETEPNISSSNRALRVELTAPRMIEWLTSAGLLGLWRLRKAFASQYEPRVLDDLKPGDIPRALYDADTSSNLLLKHVKHISNLAVEEQVAALKFLIDLAKAQSQLGSQQTDLSQGQSSVLVPAGEILDNNEEVRIDSTLLPLGLVQAIVNVMDQLGVLDQNALSAQLRELLTPEDITTSIQFLRQQLFQGGHASWLTSNVGSTEEATSPAGTEKSVSGNDARLVSFQSILRMLSACLDTIGPLQLLNSGEGDHMVETIIPELLSEVELSAQYIEDSAELQGILRETMRYSQSRESILRKDTGSVPRPGKEGQPIGEILTIYSEHWVDEATSSLAGMLPLSLRDEDFIDPIRVRKGGGQVSKRSKRETLMLEARQKGPYSFERLIL